MPAIKLAPSVLAADFSRLGADVQAVEQAGAELIHVDVMDGRFVPNISFGPVVVDALKRSTSLPLDVHLMIVEPERHLEAFAPAGADMITVHYEASPHLHRTLQAIRALGVKVGVAINPHTPAAALTEVLHMVDVVLVMSVNPGWGGQAFLPETLPKITELRAMLGERTVDISVDGGIGADNAAAVIEAGATILVAGSSIFKAQAGIQAGLAAIKHAIQS